MFLQCFRECFRECFRIGSHWCQDFGQIPLFFIFFIFYQKKIEKSLRLKIGECNHWPSKQLAAEQKAIQSVNLQSLLIEQK